MIDFTPAQDFLTSLSLNNEREWYLAHKAEAKAALTDPSKAFVEAVTPALYALDPEIVIGKGSIMRMHRDLRFSKDKRPYREELGFRFWVGDRKQGLSAFYMRILPGAVGVAVGVWGWDKVSRERYRNAVAGPAGEGLKRDLDALLAGDAHLPSEALKRTPKPWDDEHPRADLLRLKGLIVGIEGVLDAGPGVVEAVVEQWQRLAPIHHFLRDHVEAR